MKKIAGVGFTIAIIVILTLYTGKLLDPAWSSGAMNTIKAFHSQEEDSLDVIVYGSSHAWKGFDANAFSERTGLTAYNYGCNWQSLNTTKLFVSDSLRTQKPKVVCIEMYKLDELLEDTPMNGQIYYTREISDFEGKRDYLDTCFKGDLERYASYYVPLLMFHDNWTELSKENFVDYRSVDYYKKNMGYEGGAEAEKVSLKKEGNSDAVIPDKSIEILDSMVSECKAAGARVILYLAPYEGEYKYIDALESYAEEKDIDFLNMFSVIDNTGKSVFDGETDFRDKGHLNNSGAAKAAAILGDYITENIIRQE